MTPRRRVDPGDSVASWNLCASDAAAFKPLPGTPPSPRPSPRRPRSHPWWRQALACLLVFLLSTRLPGHLIARLESLRHPGADLTHHLAGALLLVLVDGFGLVCALYLGHTRLAGVRLWRCYPPQRLIPLSLHFLGLLWGLLSMAAPGGSAG